MTNRWTTIDEFREERRGRDGRLVQCHIYKDKHARRHLTIDEDVLRLEYSDSDHCFTPIPISVIVELMRRANLSSDA